MCNVEIRVQHIPAFIMDETRVNKTSHADRHGHVNEMGSPDKARELIGTPQPQLDITFRAVGIGELQEGR